VNPHPRLAGVLAACALAVASAPTSGWAATKLAHPRGVNARTGRATPPFSELVRAARKNDRAALERLAGRFGVARLGEGARSADVAVAQAALETIPFARGGVLLAGVVAERLGASEPTLAVAAARTLGALFAGDAPGALAEWEVPADVVTGACGGLRALAARVDAPVSSRLAALDALAATQTNCAAMPELVGLLRDPAPEVRRAAALLLPAGDPRAVPALRAGLSDSDPGVSAACAASVCRRVDPAARARSAADALVAQATTTARALVTAPETRPEDAVEMLACVAAAGTAADRALLEKLRADVTTPVGARAAELLGGAAPGRTE
jgi:HEAT repeat protein